MLQQVNFSHEDRRKIIFLLYALVEPNQIPIYLYSACALKVVHVLEHRIDFISCCKHLIMTLVLIDDHR